MIGRTIAHYRIVDRLGAGGMGEVYLAEDLKLGRKAAVKVIATSLTQDPDRSQRFVQEARLAASIDHPHVAAIYDVDEVDGQTFIAMEYVRGETLRALLRRGAVPLRHALEWAIQIAGAVAKVHQHGVLHRDLKPENVIVSDDGYAKIIDFGIARLIEPASEHMSEAPTVSSPFVRTVEGLVLGSVAYMSPEQARGEPVDARSDIFSFGAVLHEMLTGASPFSRRSAVETLSAILTHTPSPPAVDDPVVAPELQRIVRKCLVKDRDGRYQTMREVAVDLRAAGETLSSGDRPVVSAAALKSPTPGRSRSSAIVVAAAAVIVAIVVTAVWMRQFRAATPPLAGDRVAKPAVAVLNFDAIGGAAESAWLARGLPSLLVTGLAQNPELEVLTIDRLNEAARQVGRKMFDAVDRADQLEVVRRSGATIVVRGSIVPAADGLRLDARVEDLRTGRVVLADSVRGADPLALADDLAARIRRGLDVRPEGTVRRVAQLTTSSVEAYRLYSLANEAAGNAGWDAAAKLYGDAIALDPGFTRAHLGRATVLRLRGRLTEQRAHIAEAAAHLDRLSGRDAMHVEAAVASADGRHDDALAKYEAVIAKYPDATEAYEDAWLLALTVGRSEKAVEILERGRRALPSVGSFANGLGYAYLSLGRPDEALQHFETYLRLRPSEPNAIDSLAEGLLAAGNLPRALDTAKRALGVGYDGAKEDIGLILAASGRYDEAMTMLTDGATRTFALARLGRYRNGDRTIETARAEAVSNGAWEWAALLDLLRALVALERNDCARARQQAGLAEATSAKEGVLIRNRVLVFGRLLAGACDAREGKLADARAHRDQQRSVANLSSLPERWWVHALDGEIALASGDPAAAIAAYQTGEPPVKMYYVRGGETGLITMFAQSLILRDGVARALVAQGKLDDAIAIYRRLLVVDRSSKWSAFFEPRFVLSLARLLDRTGRRNEARTEYLRFLRYWKGADPGQPEVVEAMARAR